MRLSTKDKKYLPLGTGKVGENKIEIIRDRVYNGVTVRREFVNKEDFTNDMSHVIVVDCSLKKLFIAKIKVDALYFTGVTKAIYLRDPLLDLLIKIFVEYGNQIILFMMEKLVPLLSNGLKLKGYCCQTRNHK